MQVDDARRQEQWSSAESQQTNGQPDVHAAAAAAAASRVVVHLDHLPRPATQRQRSNRAQRSTAGDSEKTSHSEGINNNKKHVYAQRKGNEEQRAKPRQPVVGCQQRD